MGFVFWPCGELVCWVVKGVGTVRSGFVVGPIGVLGWWLVVGNGVRVVGCEVVFGLVSRNVYEGESFGFTGL